MKHLVNFISDELIKEDSFCAVDLVIAPVLLDLSLLAKSTICIITDLLLIPCSDEILSSSVLNPDYRMILIYYRPLGFDLVLDRLLTQIDKYNVSDLSSY